MRVAVPGLVTAAGLLEGGNGTGTCPQAFSVEEALDEKLAAVAAVRCLVMPAHFFPASLVVLLSRQVPELAALGSVMIFEWRFYSWTGSGSVYRAMQIPSRCAFRDCCCIPSCSVVKNVFGPRTAAVAVLLCVFSQAFLHC